MDELKELRKQVEELKGDLCRSRLINAELLRRVMSRDSSWTGRLLKAEIISFPLIVFLLAVESAYFGVSMWFVFAAALGIVVDVVVDFKTLRIRQRDILTLDMLSLRRKLMRQKTLRFRQFAVMLPLAIIWMVWFLYELFVKRMLADVADAGVRMTVATVSIGLIAVATVVVCLCIHRKLQHTNNELIARIDEYESEEQIPDGSGL